MKEQKPKEFLKNLLKTILPHPEDVFVFSEQTEDGTKLKVAVNEKDIPNVIGTEGTTADAIRKLVSLYGYKTEQNIAVRFKFDE